MTGAKKNKKKIVAEKSDKKTESVKKLVNTYNCCNLNKIESIDVISRFLYSVGCAILNKKNLTAEEILKEYATNPTFGSALVAQALHMNEIWSKNIEKEKEKL